MESSDWDKSVCCPLWFKVSFLLDQNVLTLHSVCDQTGMDTVLVECGEVRAVKSQLSPRDQYPSLGKAVPVSVEQREGGMT